MDKELKGILRSMDARLDAIERQMRDGFADTHIALHGIMIKLFPDLEIDEIRSKMRNPPDRADLPSRTIG